MEFIFQFLTAKSGHPLRRLAESGAPLLEDWQNLTTLPPTYMNFFKTLFLCVLMPYLSSFRVF